MIATKPAFSEIGFDVCKNGRFSTRCIMPNDRAASAYDPIVLQKSENSG